MNAHLARIFTCLLLLFALAATARGDGWHNAALATSSLDQWLSQSLGQLKQAIPDIEQKAKSTEVRAVTNLQDLKDKAKNKTETGKKEPAARGKLQNQLTPQQQQLLAQKSRDCMEVLACMDPQNIFPAEFPTFQLNQIPKYRETAKNLLKMMGPAGTQAVANQLRSELMGMGSFAAYDVRPHKDYYREMLDLLKEGAMAGDLSEQDMTALQQAAAGQKRGPQAALAAEVEKMLTEMENVDIPVLLNWADQIDDRDRKQRFYNKVRQKLDEATVADLVMVLGSGADKLTKDAASRMLEKRWSTSSVLELLTALDTVDDAKVQQSASAELESRSPKYAEVKEDLAEIWKLTKSSNKQVSTAAMAQIENAFLRAPVGSCLDWLAQGDKDLAKVVWAQIDDRIARADAERKAGYRDSAVAVLSDNSAKPGARLAAIDLLSRLKDRQAAEPVIDVLAQLPRDLWPKAGSLLKELTGQNFGPKSGDGVAEVSVAVKKWRAWLKENGGR
jgi:hypothetical protein